MPEVGGRPAAAAAHVFRERVLLRAAAPALLIALQCVAFLHGYAEVLGGITDAFVPHGALCGLFIYALYACALPLARLEQRTLRRGALALLGVLALLPSTVFYAVAAVCLYGFRDLPTRRVVLGYFEQLPAMIAAMPVSAATLAGACALLVTMLVALVVGFVWSCEALPTLWPPRAPAARAMRPRALFEAVPIAVLVFALLVPHEGFFIRRLEPWTRSLHDRALAESSLNMQANPAELALDQRLEAAYPTAPLGTRDHVVIIYVDALRADVLEPYGGQVPNMPFISERVAQGDLVQIQRVFAGCSMTLCGLGGILQSRPAHRVGPDNFSLPRLLHRQGYALRYLLSGDHQNFLNLKRYYAPDEADYRDGRDIDPRHATNDLRVFRELARLPPATSGRPQFLMFGLMSAHVWGERDDRFRHYLPDKLATTSFADLDRNSVEAYRNNYMNGVLQTDWVLHQIWNWLRENGYLEHAVVVITGDHGEGLGEHGLLGHARSLYNTELLVPLWIHDPQGRLRAQDLAFQQDIAPTVLDLLGLPRPTSWTGVSLLEPTPAERWQPLYYINSRDQFGLIRRRGGRTVKYLVNTRTKHEQVFDLDRDLMETDDLFVRTPAAELSEFRGVLAREFGSLLAPIE